VGPALKYAASLRGGEAFQGLFGGMTDVAGFGILIHVVLYLRLVGGKHNLALFVEDTDKVNTFLLTDGLDHPMHPLSVAHQHVVSGTPKHGIAEYASPPKDFGDKLLILMLQKNKEKDHRNDPAKDSDGQNEFRID
jgi:hypothetical protein